MAFLNSTALNFTIFLLDSKMGSRNMVKLRVLLWVINVTSLVLKKA